MHIHPIFLDLATPLSGGVAMLCTSGFVDDVHGPNGGDATAAAAASLQCRSRANSTSCFDGDRLRIVLDEIGRQG